MSTYRSDIQHANMRLTELNDLADDCDHHMSIYMDRLVAVCEQMADVDGKTMEAMLILARASEKAAIIDGTHGHVYTLSHDMNRYYGLVQEWETKTLREEQNVDELMADADELLVMAKKYESDVDSRMGPIYRTINEESKDTGACLQCTIL